MRTISLQTPGKSPEQLNVYKANLHTHSTTSDGKFSPQEMIDKYSAAGYDVLSLTDHGKHNDLSLYDHRGMTLIPGMELHPDGPRGIRWHILALNITRDIPEGIPEADAQSVIDMINRVGGYPVVAHPYWCGFTSAEVMSLKNVPAIEVSNSSCRYIGREFNMQLWDETLDAGKNYCALSVDDAHRPRDLFRNWTMLCAKSNSVSDLADALKAGNYYATQGPEFTRIHFDGTAFEAEFTPCTTAILMSRRSTGRLTMVPDFEGPGTTQVVTSMKVDVSDFPRDTYFRCQIADEDGRMAWSRPFRFPAEEEK
ncbi:MAG: CehA/McbA family metallohydrolase [Lentisphaeria bacterium]|nr:CehA/McbA family metallohydrolase [Lentisphaeria bacterium]